MDAASPCGGRSRSQRQNEARVSKQGFLASCEGDTGDDLIEVGEPAEPLPGLDDRADRGRIDVKRGSDQGCWGAVEVDQTPVVVVTASI